MIEQSCRDLARRMKHVTPLTEDELRSGGCATNTRSIKEESIVFTIFFVRLPDLRLEFRVCEVSRAQGGTAKFEISTDREIETE